MTAENIKSGDPFAVYKSMNQADGFFAIAFNNIYISFLAFVGGMLFTFGTVFLILRNGVMLGAFLLLFWQKGLLPEALSVIFIHGTLEIFSIIVAGASGFLLGTRIVITGTHGRLRSFMDGARDGVMLLLGLIPLFIAAAFLEGFVTRYSGMPEIIKMSIIFISLAFIIFYFYFYPNRLIKKGYGKNFNRASQGA